MHMHAHAGFTWLGLGLASLRVGLSLSHQVSDAALLVASDRISRMIRLLPPPLLHRMRRRSASVHIIGRRQQVSDLPEYRHLKGERGHYAGDAERAAPRDKRRPRPRRPRHYYGLSEAQLTADERTRGYGNVTAM